MTQIRIELCAVIDGTDNNNHKNTSERELPEISVEENSTLSFWWSTGVSVPSCPLVPFSFPFPITTFQYTASQHSNSSLDRRLDRVVHYHGVPLRHFRKILAGAVEVFGISLTDHRARDRGSDLNEVDAKRYLASLGSL